MSALVAHASLDPLPLRVTFLRIMCSDVGGSRMTRRAELGILFPCSSAGQWVPCFGLHFVVHLVSGLRGREVRREDRSMSGSASGSVTLMVCRGTGSVALARDTWEEWVRLGPQVNFSSPKHGL